MNTGTSAAASNLLANIVSVWAPSLTLAIQDFDSALEVDQVVDNVATLSVEESIPQPISIKSD